MSLHAQHYKFGMWLKRLRLRGIIPVGVGGNHDFLLETTPIVATPRRCRGSTWKIHTLTSTA